jgi:hypothetical protein
MPGTSPIEVLSAAITDITEALKLMADNAQMAAHRQPIDTIAKSISQQLKELGAMFQPAEQSTRDIEGIFSAAPLVQPQPILLLSAPPPNALPIQRVVIQQPAVPPGFQPLVATSVDTPTTTPTHSVASVPPPAQTVITMAAPI